MLDSKLDRILTDFSDFIEELRSEGVLEPTEAREQRKGLGWGKEIQVLNIPCT